MSRGARVHLVGIGGSGMSSLAVVLAGKGMQVSGSDRDRDRGENRDLFAALGGHGIVLYPQDGSGVTAGPDEVVASGAVEAAIPDLAQARARGIPILHRAEVLARLAGSHRAIAVAGTSGKSTVTAMIACILRDAGRSPTFLGGAPLIPSSGPAAGARPGPAAWSGEGPELVFEADESDGSLTRYRPEIGVITNLSEDHRPLAELREIFQTFADSTTGVLLTSGERASITSRRARNVTFGLLPGARFVAADIQLGDWDSVFRFEERPVRLRVPGRFNVENAAAALATAEVLGVPGATAIAALAAFPGLSRRMERVGVVAGVTVVDDFAHNPDKVEAALRALRREGRRLRIVFQLHGFGPARMHFQALVAAFGANLRGTDRLYLAPVYYAGGTVVRDIGAGDYVRALRGAGVDAVAVERDARLAPAVASDCEPGDVAVVMGARDPTLPGLAREVLRSLAAAAPGAPAA